MTTHADMRLAWLELIHLLQHVVQLPKPSQATDDDDCDWHRLATMAVLTMVRARAVLHLDERLEGFDYQLPDWPDLDTLAARLRQRRDTRHLPARPGHGGRGLRLG